MWLTSFFSLPSGASSLDLDHWDGSLQHCGLLGHLSLGCQQYAIPVAPVFVLYALLALLPLSFHDTHNICHACALIALEGKGWLVFGDCTKWLVTHLMTSHLFCLHFNLLKWPLILWPSRWLWFSIWGTGVYFCDFGLHGFVILIIVWTNWVDHNHSHLCERPGPGPTILPFALQPLNFTRLCPILLLRHHHPTLHFVLHRPKSILKFNLP